MNPPTPVVTPMAWAVTNMTTQSGEYFYRLPASMSGRIPSATAHALKVTLGAATVIRPASDKILHRAILASAAIPVVFDPVVLPMIDGTDGVYVDGSNVSNAAVSIARTVASNIDVILVDAKSGRTVYPNALAVAFGAYGTMQREVLETAMRDIYFQTLDERSRAPRSGDLPAGRIRYARPEQPLAPDIGVQRAARYRYHVRTRRASRELRLLTIRLGDVSPLKAAARLPRRGLALVIDCDSTTMSASTRRLAIARRAIFSRPASPASQAEKEHRR